MKNKFLAFILCTLIVFVIGCGPTKLELIFEVKEKEIVATNFGLEADIAELEEAVVELEEYNAELEEANIELEEAVTELEESNIELEESNIELEEAITELEESNIEPVSYTHLTLPTKA